MHLVWHHPRVPPSKLFNRAFTVVYMCRSSSTISCYASKYTHLYHQLTNVSHVALMMFTSKSTGGIFLFSIVRRTLMNIKQWYNHFVLCILQKNECWIQISCDATKLYASNPFEWIWQTYSPNFFLLLTLEIPRHTMWHSRARIWHATFEGSKIM